MTTGIKPEEYLKLYREGKMSLRQLKKDCPDTKIVQQAITEVKLYTGKKK
jgi:hypothetical protein